MPEQPEPPVAWGSWWISTNAYPAVTDWLTRLRDCLQCKHQFTDPWLISTGQSWPGSVQLNAEVAFHWQDTHGYPADMLADLVGSRIGMFGAEI